MIEFVSNRNGRIESVRLACDYCGRLEPEYEDDTQSYGGFFHLCEACYEELPYDETMYWSRIK
jgi:hypothetical protein